MNKEPNARCNDDLGFDMPFAVVQTDIDCKSFFFKKKIHQSVLFILF
jgi:hypothetical protein